MQNGCLEEDIYNMKETIPFTYKLIFKPTGQYYYGVRWAKGCNPKDLWVTYFTSSKHIKKLIKKYGEEAFEYKVTKIFTSKKDAGEWETNILKRVNANRNGKMLNKAINMPVWDASGLRVIHHVETHLETFHDVNIELPVGWVYGQSQSHINNNQKSHLILYSDPNYKPWNKGGGKPTGPCKESRKNAIKEARINTPKIACTYCEKEVDPGNFKRFHGEQCKLNPNIDPQLIMERSVRAKQSIQTQKETGTFSKPKTPVGIFKCNHCEKESSNYGVMQRHHFNRCKFKKD